MTGRTLGTSGGGQRLPSTSRNATPPTQQVTSVRPKPPSAPGKRRDRTSARERPRVVGRQATVSAFVFSVVLLRTRGRSSPSLHNCKAKIPLGENGVFLGKAP